MGAAVGACSEGDAHSMGAAVGACSEGDAHSMGACSQAWTLQWVLAVRVMHTAWVLAVGASSEDDAQHGCLQSGMGAAVGACCEDDAHSIGACSEG
eukprot:1157755-Pelagomonas_calceolata.AAC.8